MDCKEIKEMPNEQAAKTGHHWLAMPKTEPGSS